jgi:hypothetical protein
LDFAARFEVSIDWLFRGRGAGIASHLSQQANGVIAILPRGEGCPIPEAVLRARGRSKAKRRSIASRIPTPRSSTWAVGRNARKQKV